MAKKRKKRRPPPRPAAPADQQQARQEKKEVARREREDRIRRARRRVLLRRLVRFAAVVVVLGLIVGFIVYRNRQDARVISAADAAAETLRCTEVQEQPNEGRQHLQAGQQPTFATKPATSGNHSPSTLDPEVSVYEDPIDANLEPLAVHNLEHAYVIMYYRAEGEQALPRPVVDAIADLAEAEDKVILAPYPELPDGRSLAFAAWQRLQTCPRVTDPDAALDVANGFIKRFRGGGVAPEAGAP